ncbi:hypothetical protein [Pararhizobium sp. A13]|uniref:hypothetical protein n=1 Tax=Pararhizobium sp. A13 TaxID=3133975 RepID=UPI00324EC111
MQIEFYNKAGEKIVAVLVDTDDHWEACEQGHTMLQAELICGADDFQVLED